MRKLLVVETPVVVTDVVVVSPQFAFVLTYFLRLLNEARSEDERAHTEGVAHKDGSQRKAQARETGWKWRITHNTNLPIRGQKDNLSDEKVIHRVFHSHHQEPRNPTHTRVASANAGLPSTCVDVNEAEAGLVTLGLVFAQQYACGLSPGEVVEADISGVFADIWVSC